MKKIALAIIPPFRFSCYPEYYGQQNAKNALVNAAAKHWYLLKSKANGNTMPYSKMEGSSMV